MGSRLAFFLNDFDLLCSDQNKVRLARVAATSSAVRRFDLQMPRT
jgi:hypothetical protein